ncbi:zinc finger protein 37-like isoform X1 [Neodiprion fabricii]|uniref:zinc finger protein 37-like isoform X1 n=1 Tax=Neodiprion fabricii TaxID=2872261 RepID=UPI001ED8D04D|nr:zinc finger protein 37-like isoform X1 [Neodiprion fabricii]XP_046419013.1 zinc finger protein 37-like isoform X1 [Neodiprion fabricii]XP_046419014.1 zinc finger protein 37-like isoform X1 [Neodiprion fabricii]
MGSSQQFSLRWNNYLKHITCAFDTLRTDEDLVDVTLSCEGKRIRAHKMLLSACSTYFRDLFKENPCQHPVIIFRNVKFDDLAALVDFMYQGEVNVVQEQLASFLTTAELLAVQGLTDGTGKDSDSVNEEDADIPNEPEVQLKNPASKLPTSNHGSKSPASPRNFPTLDIQSETPPNKRRKCRESSGANTEKGSTGNTVSAIKESERKNLDSNNTPSGDSVEIIPLMPNLKLEMPEYLEQDGSSCSYEDQSAGESSTNRIVLDETPSDILDHEQKPDISHSFYSANQSTSDTSLDITHQSADQGHLLSKPSTSGERLSQEAVQGGVGRKQKHVGDATAHMVMQGPGRFACSLCGSVYKHLASLSQHLEVHRNKTTCVLCDTTLSRRTDLRRHMHLKHNMQWQKTMKRRRDSKKRRATKRTDLWYPITESTGRVKYVCKICGAKYSHVQTMTGHFKLHWGQTICYLCGKVFSRKPHLVRHLLQKHSIDWSRRGRYKTLDVRNKDNNQAKNK